MFVAAFILFYFTFADGINGKFYDTSISISLCTVSCSTDLPDAFVCTDCLNSLSSWMLLVVDTHYISSLNAEHDLPAYIQFNCSFPLEPGSVGFLSYFSSTCSGRQSLKISGTVFLQARSVSCLQPPVLKHWWKWDTVFSQWQMAAWRSGSIVGLDQWG